MTINQQSTKPKAASYSRISTLLQGQSLDNQRVPIEEFAQSRGFDLVARYQDEGISGAKERRPGLDQCVADARRGKFKLLIVMEVSRLARDVRHLLNLLHELDQIGVSVVSIREGIEFQSAMGKAMVAMIGIFMSVERDLIRERIKTALATKKMAAAQTGNGWRCGRKPADAAKVEQAKALLAQNRSIREVAKVVGIGKSTVERIKRGRR